MFYNQISKSGFADWGIKIPNRAGIFFMILFPSLFSRLKKEPHASITIIESKKFYTYCSTD